MPRLVRNIYGSTSDRGTLKLPIQDSAAIYLGGFVPYVTGDFASGDGVEFGVPAFSDDAAIFGIAVGFTKSDSLLPIDEETSVSGTITAATGELPLKYTAASTNDQSNTSSAVFDMVEILPIQAGDILEVSLWGASTASVARGTTVAAGTTDSTANMGVGLSVNATYHFALTESTGDKDLTDVDFVTTLLDGKQPEETNRVYVMPLRTFDKFSAADAA